MNMNLEEEFEELTQKNDDDESLDETDEFQNINTIDEGLTKAILGILIIYKSKSKYTEVFSFYLEFSERTSKIQTHSVLQDITNIIF